MILIVIIMFLIVFGCLALFNIVLFLSAIKLKERWGEKLFGHPVVISTENK